MSFPERLTSKALSLFNALEETTQARVHVLAAAGGILVTIGMWSVHLSYPEIFSTLFEHQDRWTKFFLGFVLAPPFLVGFSIGSFICRDAYKPVKDESGPMSGYFYRQRADKKYWILIVAGLLAGLNLLLMIITSASV